MRLRRPSVGPAGVLAFAIGPVVVIAIAFYVWTVATSTSLDPGPSTDPYNELVDGFSHGHLYLPITPDPRLKDLPDPYEPRYNGSILDPSLRDLVFYKDRFYIYWGPAPALLAFWPFRALGVGDLPPGIAVLAFCILGLLCVVGLLVLLIRRYLPTARPWMVGVGTAVLAFGSMAPWVLRRPNAYEVAISAGYCFFWAGALLLVLAFPREGPPRPWRMAGSGLCFGLAFASRPPMGIGVVLALGALYLLRRSGRLADRPALVRFAALLVAPAAACIVAVAIYNAVRFGAPSDFGTTKMLAGSKQDRFFSFAYVPPGLWLYLLYPVRLVAAFPFFWANLPHVPFPHTSGYDASERTAGLLPTVPFIALLVLARPALRRAPDALRGVVIAAAATGAFLLVFTAFFYWGSVMRYEMDFATLFIVAATLVWLAFDRSRSHRRARVASAWVGAVLAGISVVVVAAISLIGSDDRLRSLHPGTFDSLQSFFSPVSALFADAAGHPILASIGGDPFLGSDRYDRVGVEGVHFFLGTGPYPMQIVSASRTTAHIEAVIRRLPSTPRRPKLVVQVRSADGSIFSAPVANRLTAIPVSLERGANPITIQLFADRRTRIPPYADSADDGAVLVDGLRVSPAA
jgi:uncharacterized membrane protein (GlpM family)